MAVMRALKHNIAVLSVQVPRWREHTLDETNVDNRGIQPPIRLDSCSDSVKHSFLPDVVHLRMEALAAFFPDTPPRFPNLIAHVLETLFSLYSRRHLINSPKGEQLLQQA